MENLSKVPNDAILRRFDMKGSTANRDVLKKNPNIKASAKVLKDIDFINLEG